jgi:hypothetical protein
MEVFDAGLIESIVAEDTAVYQDVSDALSVEHPNRATEILFNIVAGLSVCLPFIVVLVILIENSREQSKPPAASLAAGTGSTPTPSLPRWL